MENYKYRAFISYSHKDERWGKWLHRKLESFRVPAQLVGKQAKHGAIPKRLFPVFRDRDELPSSSRLGEAIKEALDQSLHLIVICSPHAAKSEWVNQEIKDFKTMGRERRILYLIISGEPYAADRPGAEGEECFPEAAKYSVGSDGFYMNVRAEPIAADAREVGDGQRNAFLKIIAGMLGVGLDDLKRRALQQRHRKLGLIAAASTMAAVATIALATYAFMQRNAAEEARSDALQAKAVAVQSQQEAENEQSKERKIVEVQQVQNRRFETAKAKIEADKRTKIEIAQHKRNEARDGIHNGYRLWTLLLAPVPALLLGIVTLVRRSSRASAIVPQNRQVGGGAK